MADSSKKVSELPLAANISVTDRLLVLYNANTPANQTVRTVNVGTLTANIMALGSFVSYAPYVPANTNTIGTAGMLSYDNTYIYVCVAGNTWMRSTLSTF